MMKICFVTGEFPPVIGGIASHVDELANALVRNGISVSVVHPLSPRTEVKPVKSSQAKVYNPQFMRAKPFYDFYLKQYLSELLKRENHDLIHVHGIRPLLATRGLGLPVVFTNHSSGFLARRTANYFRRWRTAKLLRHLDYVIAPSDELVESVRDFGYQGPVKMIPNGVDATRFMPAGVSKRADFGIADHEIVILLARRLVPKNGVVWFARAVAAMKNKSARIVIAGDGVDRAEMVRILEMSGDLGRCLFLGKIDNDMMPDIYRLADISVLPSLAEATSIAGLEAMATALPLVGTTVGGIPAIIDERRNGLLVPPRDSAALAHALDELVADRNLCVSLGQRARERAVSEFSWSVIAQKTADIYSACL